MWRRLVDQQNMSHHIALWFLHISLFHKFAENVSKLAACIRISTFKLLNSFIKLLFNFSYVYGLPSLECRAGILIDFFLLVLNLYALCLWFLWLIYLLVKLKIFIYRASQFSTNWQRDFVAFMAVLSPWWNLMAVIFHRWNRIRGAENLFFYWRFL